MRKLTQQEIDKLYSTKACIFCGSRNFWDGPCGGMAQNIKCADCKAIYNIGIGVRWAELIKPPEDPVIMKVYESRQAEAEVVSIDRKSKRILLMLSVFVVGLAVGFFVYFNFWWEP